MADLTDDNPPESDVVTCICGRQWDRNIYSQCTNCLTNLWELRSGDTSPAPPGANRTGTDTVMEGQAPRAPGIDVLVCGRRLTVAEGRTLRLGRHDDLETAEVFREARNVSRMHAELRFENGRLHVTDTRSANGTYVDGQPLPPGHEYEIRRGQSLRLASNVPVEIVWGLE